MEEDPVAVATPVPGDYAEHRYDTNHPALHASQGWYVREDGVFVDVRFQLEQEACADVNAQIGADMITQWEIVMQRKYGPAKIMATGMGYAADDATPVCFCTLRFYGALLQKADEMREYSGDWVARMAAGAGHYAAISFPVHE